MSPTARTLHPSMRRLLALATLATAGAVALPAAAAPGMGVHGEGRTGAGMSRMLEKAGASPEQRSQIEQIMNGARQDMRAQNEQQRALQTQMRQQFAQPTVDEAAVEALRQQMLALHDARSQRMTQAMLEASRVLSAEQRQQLSALMAQRGQRGERGMQGERGHRHGG